MSQEAEHSLETIEWNDQDIPANDPRAAYGKISEKLRHALPEEKVCSMFCGGRKCKYCTAHTWTAEQMVIDGLYSSWITENILAMARPGTENMEKYKMIGQFQEQQIKSIVNLQTPGEHSSCGGGLEPEGFSYVPQTFMDSDIFFYNFGWRDYSVGSLSIILDMVKVMQFAISEGKIAVHCHAGLGRTGVMIACYLVFNNRMSANDAIHYIRVKRPGSIQTRSQIICIQEFAQYLKPLYIIFSSVDNEAYDFNLNQFLIRQKHMLHGIESRKLKHLPKICFVTCERLLELAERGRFCEQEHDTISLIKETASSAFYNRDPSSGKDTRMSSTLKSIQSFPELGPHTFQSLSTDRSFSYDPTNGYDNIKRARSPNVFSHNGTDNSLNSRVSDISEDGVDSQRYGSYEDMLSEYSGLMKNSRRSLGGRPVTQNAVDPVVSRISHALSVTEYEEQDLQAIEKYKIMLNTENGWSTVQKEENPIILAGLMLHWLDHLKEPVLQIQDLQHMLSHSDDPVTGLHKLDKGSKRTTEYLIGVIVRLSPLPEEVEVEMLQRILSTLTQQNMMLEENVLLATSRSSGRRTMNTGEMNDTLARKMINFFINLLDSLKSKFQSTEASKQA